MNPKLSRYYTFIKPLTQNRLIRTYSGLIFSLISIIIFSLFALKPTISTILNLQKQIEEKQSILKDLNQKAQDLTTAKDNLNRINSETLKKLDNLLPDKTDPSSLAEAINSLSTQASISAFQLQPTTLVGDPQNLSKKPLLEPIGFNFNATGSYSNLLSLLGALNRLPRLISIDSVNITPNQAGLLMSVSAKAYYLKNE